MAPSPPLNESFYLSSLDKCFTAGHRLISWRTAFEALTDLQLAKQSPNLESFLLDDLAIHSLASIRPLFDAPSDQSKSDFEARTAPVNLTPTKTDLLNTDQIKNDALWLSKLVQVDEVLALRVVVLEWQNRSAAHLLNSCTEQELISLTQALGTTQVGNLFSNEAANVRTRDDSDDSRHARLLLLLLEEQEYLLRVNLALRVASGLSSPPTPNGRVYGIEPQQAFLPWIQGIVAKLTAAHAKRSSLDKASLPSALLIDLVQSIQADLEGWEAGPKWSSSFSDPSYFDAVFRTSRLQLAVLHLQLAIVQIAVVDQFPSALAVQTWFEFVDHFGFLELLLPHSAVQAPMVDKTKALVSFVSLQMLRLPWTIAYLSQHSAHARPPPVIHDAACRSQVDQTLRQAANRLSQVASPAIFAWSIILQTLGECVQLTNAETSSDEDPSIILQGLTASRKPFASLPSPCVEAWDLIMDNATDGSDPAEFYARNAVDACGVLDIVAALVHVSFADCGFLFTHMFELTIRLSLLELLRPAVLLIGYKPEIFACVLQVLSVQENNGDDYHRAYLSTSLANVFMNDDEVLVPRLLHQAYLRYPYESTPLLKLSKVLIRHSGPNRSNDPIAQPLCEQSPYFTSVLPAAFNGYELVREDENANGVRLTQELPIVINRTWRTLMNLRPSSGSLNYKDSRISEDRGEFFLPSGTTGIVISESKPFVVAWDHVHPPLSYLACVLSTVCVTSNRQDISNDEIPAKEFQSDIIHIFAKLIGADGQAIQAKNNQAESAAKLVLEEASDLLDRNQDIISVIAEIFEQELSQLERNYRSSSIMILSGCLEFFSALLTVIPSRVWPILARSQLLDMDGNGGLLNAAISAESTLGSCIFFEACLDLFNTLSRQVVTQVVSSQSIPSASSERFRLEVDNAQSIPKKTMSKILFSFTRASLDVLQALQTWQSVGLDVKASLTSRVMGIFQNVLTYVYAYDDLHQPQEKICGALSQAATLIYETATASDSSGLVTNLLLSMAVSSQDSQMASMRQISTRECRNCIREGLGFLVTVLNVSLFFGTSKVHLEQQLLRSSPLFVRIFAGSDQHKSSIISLLSCLVRRLGASTKKPPSILGSLGIDNALAFSNELTNLSKPLGRNELECQTWEFAASVVSSQQQWLASFLMTGDTPKNSLKRKDDRGSANKHLSNTMLGMALDKLSETESFHDATSLSSLKFIFQAQNYWPWVTDSIRRHAGLVEKLLNYVEALSTNLSRAELEEPNQTYAASLIAEILAIYVHNMRQLGDVSPAKLIAPKLGFYRDNAVALPTYNSSLHSNLKRNFEQKFAGCDLRSFKRIIGSSDFGRNYCYDVGFAEQVLSYHQSWNTTKEQGFRTELSKANSNLSLVESQLLLFAGWKSLCTEICYSFADYDNLQKQMIGVASNCLLSNIESNLPDSIFEHLLQARAELSLLILQRLISVRSTESGLRRILTTAWNAILASGQDFETAFWGDNSTYYRTLLRILLLSLLPHTHVDAPGESSRAKAKNTETASQASKDLQNEIFPVIVEVASKVVGKGFQSLCSQIHQEVYDGAIPDFQLLTNIIQTLLRVKDITTHQAHLSVRLCDTGAHRHAVTLFSWADRLATENDDPIFGEVAISFLRELSSLPPMAEFLAAEGVLSQLNSAPIMTQIKESNSTRLQEIWSLGIMPLVLNLLISVGDSFAAEAAAFLNTFQTRLDRASSYLRFKAAPSRTNPWAGTLNLSVAAELNTLATISVALNRYRDSPAVSAAAAAGHEIHLKWDRMGIREDIEASLHSSRADLNAKIVPTNTREAQLQKSTPLGNAQGGEDGCENRLEECVVMELKGALSYLVGLD